MAEDKYTVERTAIIDAPPERIYAQIVDFHNWTNWSPWEDVDPAMRRSYSGAESGTGSVYSWSGNRKAGQGRMVISDTSAPTKVHIDLSFEKPWKSRNDTMFTIEPSSEGSVVTWTMTGEKTLMTKVLGIFTSMDKMVGPDFEKGLANLKATTESQSRA